MHGNLILKRLSFVLLSIIVIGFTSCSKSDPPEPQEIVRYLPGVYPNSEITDGPFIYDNGSRYIIKWISKNRDVIERQIIGDDYGNFEADFGFPFEYINQFKTEASHINYTQEFNNVEKLIALSDIHGQYDVFIRLLRNNLVIDERNNWIFGSGHLVINGDIFDRGNRVTEILWLVFKLENQAKVSGGKVHFLLGNHEVMVMNNDLRYIDPKYNTTARRLGTTYDQLYSKNLIIGQWLRTKPVIVKINDMIFNHAGISSEFVSKNLNQELVNKAFINDIIDKDEDAIEADPLLDYLTGSNGPIWYRGYFEDNSFNHTKLDAILNHLGASYIIVGHTSMDEIKFYYSGKVIAIDSSIKEGITGQVLIYDNGNFRIGTIN